MRCDKKWRALICYAGSAPEASIGSRPIGSELGMQYAFLWGKVNCGLTRHHSVERALSKKPRKTEGLWKLQNPFVDREKPNPWVSIWRISMKISITFPIRSFGREL